MTFLFLICHPVISLSSFDIYKNNVWSSCLNFPITLDCEIPHIIIIIIKSVFHKPWKPPGREDFAFSKNSQFLTWRNSLPKLAQSYSDEEAIPNLLLFV